MFREKKDALEQLNAQNGFPLPSLTVPALLSFLESLCTDRILPLGEANPESLNKLFDPDVQIQNMSTSRYFCDILRLLPKIADEGLSGPDRALIQDLLQKYDKAEE